MNIYEEIFAKESDKIEGEKYNPQHLVSLQRILYNDLDEEILLNAHKLFAPCEKWSGKYRDVNVSIGGEIAPSPALVKELMHNWFLDLPKMDSYEAHVRFEKIHPFQDGNGRIGRAVWLKKALNEGYDYRISFLHQFYYQVLSNSK